MRFFLRILVGISIISIGGSASRLCAADHVLGSEKGDVTWLAQGWNDEQRQWFYHQANQGSHLVPYDWFLRLEQPENEHLMRENEHIEQLRFLSEPVDAAVNPDGLPVGFVKDTVADAENRQWLGLTCAACHTTQINYQSHVYRIDGGPGQGDLQTLQTELTAALQKTSQDDAKFARFARGVLGASAGNKATSDKLRADLQKVAEQRAAFDERNKTDSRYGFARVDAFGIILNEVLGGALGVKGNLKPPNAPVSYPFLWDTPQHEHIQWNGVVPNHPPDHPPHTTYVGPLARNVGEVLGVFGEVEVPHGGEQPHLLIDFPLHQKKLGYSSSARRVNLLVIEELLKKLYSPEWPAEFPPINAALATRGQVLFAQNCAKCHQEVVNPTGLTRIVGEVMTPIAEVGTDPLMATNFATRRADPGPLVGQKKMFLFGKPFTKDEPASDVLVHVIAGVVINTPFENVDPIQVIAFDRLLGGHELMAVLLQFITTVHADFAANLDMITDKILRPLDELYSQPEPDKGPVYKGRPLDGIWATAPYLHNGSVPNLAQLLLPAKDRVTRFYVGSREFDPKNVGFVSDQKFDGAFEFRVTGDDGKVIPGNSNAGHEYGTNLSQEDRDALVEYMKAL